MRRKRLQVSTRPGNVAAMVASLCGLVSLLVVLGFGLHAFKRMASESSPDLPALRTASRQDVTPGDLLLRLTPGGAVIEGNVPLKFTAENLAIWMKNRREAAPLHPRVFIALPEGAAAGEVADVIGILQQAGFSEFSLLLDRQAQ